MNSNLFGKNDIIGLLNIDDEDFEFEYNAAEGNAPYVIPAGEVRRFPGWLANHGLKHLIDKILTKRDIKTSNVVERQRIAEQIVVSTESLSQRKEPTEDELLNQRVRELNQPSDLELLVNKRATEGKTPEKEPVAATPVVLVEPPKEEIKKEPEKEAPKEPEKEVKKEEPKSLPTKADLIIYAENTLKMHMDNKTIKKLRAMTVPKLIKELNYPTE